MKKGLWYTLGVIAAGALLYFVLGWFTSLLTIVALIIAVSVVFMFVQKRLDKS